jgi:hypothetical protein
MDPTALGKLLRYGAMGFGLALAILTGILLATEQRASPPRREMLLTIVAFMVFSLVLTLAGLGAEVKTRLAESMLRTANNELQSKLTNSREQLLGLLNLKNSALGRLAELTPSDPGYNAVVSEIRSELESLAKGMTTVLTNS